jgi:hypothetical protein
MSADEELVKAAERVNSDGVRRFGQDRWSQGLAAIGRALPPGVDAGEVVKGALRHQDPAGILQTAGREALINEASNGDKEAEATYSSWRAEERKKHAQRKGRVA